MAHPQLTRTPAGHEMQFATNHLGHFALATGLHQWLAAANGARVVSVASIGHLFSPVVFDDLHYRFRPYDQWTSYGQSKSANVLFAVGAAKRWADDGIAINALMPGNVATTALARHMGADDLANFGETTALALPPVKTIEQGAATSVFLAASPDVAKVTGRYYEDCAEAPQVTERGTHTGGVAPYALDPKQCRPPLADLQRADPTDLRERSLTQRSFEHRGEHPADARFDFEDCVRHARVAAVERRYFLRWIGHLPECARQ